MEIAEIGLGDLTNFGVAAVFIFAAGVLWRHVVKMQLMQIEVLRDSINAQNAQTSAIKELREYLERNPPKNG